VIASLGLSLACVFSAGGCRFKGAGPEDGSKGVGAGTGQPDYAKKSAALEKAGMQKKWTEGKSKAAGGP